MRMAEVDEAVIERERVGWGKRLDLSPRHSIKKKRAAWGRDHNANAMAVWLAGGGVHAGQIVGATDEVGGAAVECIHPLKDFHVTLLRLLGLDDNKLRYLHAGRDKQLSQTGGVVIKELLA